MSGGRRYFGPGCDGSTTQGGSVKGTKPATRRASHKGFLNMRLGDYVLLLLLDWL